MPFEPSDHPGPRRRAMTTNAGPEERGHRRRCRSQGKSPAAAPCDAPPAEMKTAGGCFAGVTGRKASPANNEPQDALPSWDTARADVEVRLQSLSASRALPLPPLRPVMPQQTQHPSLLLSPVWLAVEPPPLLQPRQPSPVSLTQRQQQHSQLLPPLLLRRPWRPGPATLWPPTPHWTGPGWTLSAAAGAWRRKTQRAKAETGGTTEGERRRGV